MKDNQTQNTNDKLTNNSLMPFGKHKGKKMANVPYTYLLWLWRESNNKSGNVFDYIRENLDALKAEEKQDSYMSR